VPLSVNRVIGLLLQLSLSEWGQQTVNCKFGNRRKRLNFPLSIGEWGRQTVDCGLEEGDRNKLNLHWPGNMPKVI
jgi:hypothetical protein